MGRHITLQTDYPEVFFFLQDMQTGSGARLAFFSIGIGLFSRLN